MKIGIYNEPSGGSIGGCEVSVAVLAEAFSKKHEVEILHNRPSMTAAGLAQYAGVDLGRVRLKIWSVPETRRAPRNFWERHWAARDAQAEVTGAYDLFVAFTHGLPPYCAARTGVLMMLFPLDSIKRPVIPVGRNLLSLSWLRRQMGPLLAHWILNSGLRSYQAKATNSEFTRGWTRRRWGIDCRVVYPPVSTTVEPGEKADSILSVGRFSPSGVGKKQMEMVELFKELKAAGHGTWQYDCVGGCAALEEDQAFLAKVCRSGADCGANVAANVRFEELKNLYRKARIFWHAAGMDVDETSQPELLEHFGMSTVEAMAAGCVPVVINKGGQSEIVEHGVSGFLWNTLKEWREYTVRLMEDEALVRKMSAAARARAQLFSREAFVDRFRAMLPAKPNVF